MGTAEKKSYRIQIIVILISVAGVLGAAVISKIFKEPVIPPPGHHVEPDSGPERPGLAAEEPVEAALLPKPGDVVINSIGMKLVYIPDGSFMMGSSDSAAQLAKEYNIEEKYFADEFPQHQVRISKGFWMGQTEVTQGQYKSVMNAQPWPGQDYVQEDANNPAVYVNWDDAAAFCRKLSQQEGKMYRLPTEAEWEYACRAGTTTRFSFGDSDSSLGDYAWCRSNAYEVGQKYAHSVRQKKPNPLDLYDMHGNVWEWCSDRYDKDYYSNSPSVAPKGPGPSSGASTRSLRGGLLARLRGRSALLLSPQLLPRLPPLLLWFSSCSFPAMIKILIL